MVTAQATRLEDEHSKWHEEQSICSTLLRLDPTSGCCQASCRKSQPSAPGCAFNAGSGWGGVFGAGRDFIWRDRAREILT
ncbi:hypothetical protein TRIATDRAFT_299752 [Trichoderma atroviride IMI 206040]|uniref:Uncharacterized protein n=1 Tax=Hypocrea atroviridis (strain ATCC 20476 / IMI 206040) TaxID=452589 RepID=G9NVF7_HYPAI|nr:uncharacterized protein TRIATDRAFT_299752 [Trichoderma atroviride IMI 206040]EHK44978.1 hypothetical protein TRIATDRAFT_299752 [Trichoderma atroviride IMI 206040]